MDRRLTIRQTWGAALMPAALAMGTLALLGCGGGGYGGNGYGGTGTPAPTPISVTVTPPNATLATANAQSFSATVSGGGGYASAQDVAWSIQEGLGSDKGGTLSNITLTSVTYTAPAAAGVYHLIATSASDGTKSATAAITVN